MALTAIQQADELIDDELQEEEKPVAPYTLRDACKAMWRHIAPLKHGVFVLVILGILSAITNGAVPYVTGRFFDTLITLASGGEHTESGLPLWGILLFLWLVIQLAANIVDWIMDRHGESVWLKLRLRLEAESFVHLIHLPLNYHKSARLSGTMNTITNGSWRMSTAARNITKILPQLLSVLIGITLVISINYALAGILLSGVLIYAGILFFMLRNIAHKDDRAHRTWNSASTHATATVYNTETVKQATAEKHETAKIRQLLLNRTYNTWRKLEIHWSNVSFFQRVTIFFTQLGVFVFSINLITNGVITVGELVAVNGYALMFFGPLVQLGHTWQVIQNGFTTAVHLSKILDVPPENYHPAHAHTGTKMMGAVAFRDVSFRYEEELPHALKHINFETAPGDVIALVGESGGGKSTVLGLLSAYYFPTTGVVTVDGVATNNFDLYALRSRIAIVPQEVTLFNDTIKNNIRYGVFTATDTDIARAAEEAHLSEFIATLPKGFDTPVGERGVKLSVGQKQRVAIARAILRDPAILILDEPTSALDAQTEHYITEALGRLMKERTTFIIAHRLSTVRRANNILVFSKGTIVESGTHEGLLKKANGVYRNLYEHQIGLHG